MNADTILVAGPAACREGSMPDRDQPMNFQEMQREARLEWERFTRPGRFRVLVGAGTCGRMAGAAKVAEAFREELHKRSIATKVKVYEVGCLGLCDAEVLVEIQGRCGTPVLYQRVTVDMVPKLLEAHLMCGKPPLEWALAVMRGRASNGIPLLAEFPVAKHRSKTVFRNCGVIDPTNIHHYLARGGYAGLASSLALPPDMVFEEITASWPSRGETAGDAFSRGLDLGRWTSKGNRCVVCDVADTGAGASVDRTLLEGDPHAVLEGLVITGYAVGAKGGCIRFRGESSLALERTQTAVQNMKQKGLLGKNLMNSGFDFDIEITSGTGSTASLDQTPLKLNRGEAAGGRDSYAASRPDVGPACQGACSHGAEVLAWVASVFCSRGFYQQVWPAAKEKS